MPTAPRARRLIQRIQRALSPDLLSAKYVDCALEHPVAGHCYAAAEALFHAMGGKAAGLTAMVARDADGGTHWWLVDSAHRVLDPTAEQFTAFGKEPPYAQGRRVGFLTRTPSRRARAILERAALA